MTTATAKIMNQFERRPTYNELVEMIEEEELKVKPSIENVIDRKASIFRNNQYGGRFDNPDLVGLQKQEQMTTTDDETSNHERGNGCRPR